MLTVGELFAGIGGFGLAAERAGMRVAWQSEIDPQASRVLAHHWPDVPNHGDITAIDGAELEPVDVITGGFPCQDLSVAGKRAGLNGARSGLFFEFMRVVGEMREATAGVSPSLVVIENVPGLLNSHGGADFGVLLDTLADLGALDIGWAVLDAQWFGVPQRRRRVFVVVDFGGRRAGEILALSEGLRGDSPPRREARQGVAGTLGGGAGERGWAPDTDRMTFVPFTPAGHADNRHGVGTLRADGGDVGNGSETLVAHTLRADGFDASEDGTGRGTPLVPFRKSRRAQSADDHETWVEDEVANTLNTFDNGDVRTTEIIAFQQNQRDEVRDLGDVAGALSAQPGMKQQSYLAFAMRGREEGNVPEVSGDVSPAIRGASGGSTHTHVAFTNRGLESGASAERLRAGSHGALPMVASQMAVRRLTPRECERLQGFPDDWTVPAGSDSARYKALGNAVAVPVVERIGRQIVSVLL